MRREQLVVLHHGSGSPGRSAFSVGELEDYRKTPGLDALAELHTMWFILLSPPGRPGERMPERVSTGVVSPNYFPMLGVRAALGRLLTEADDRAGAPAALLLTHDYWQRAFYGDPSVVGRVFEMNDRPHTVVGVLAPFPQYRRRSTSTCRRLHVRSDRTRRRSPNGARGWARPSAGPPTVSPSSRCRGTWRVSRPASNSANLASTRTRADATSPRRRRSPRKCARSFARRCCSWRPRRRWCCSSPASASAT